MITLHEGLEKGIATSLMNRLQEKSIKAKIEYIAEYQARGTRQTRSGYRILVNESEIDSAHKALADEGDPIDFDDFLTPDEPHKCPRCGSEDFDQLRYSGWVWLISLFTFFIPVMILFYMDMASGPKNKCNSCSQVWRKKYY